MEHENKREECEEPKTLQEGVLEGELRKAKDEKDVIDFMDIVDQNIVQQGEETSKECEETARSYLDEIEDQTNLNEEAYAFEEHTDILPGGRSFRNKIAMFERRVASSNISEERTHETLEELNTLIRESGTEQELLSGVNKAEEDHLPLEESVIEDLKPFNRSLEKRKVIRLNTDVVEVKGLPSPYGNNLRIQKYPGFLYINLSSIERYMSTDQNVKSVNVRLESDDIVYETSEFNESSTVNLDTMVYLGVANMEKPVKLRFILQKLFHGGKPAEKVCETEIVIDKNSIGKIHNNLTDFESFWTPYISNNLIKSFFSFFTNSVADAWSIKTKIAYISEEELQVLGRGTPKDLYELSRWIKIKKYSYTSWYSGFVNIRGNTQDACTFLWKRRYIQWKGYVITVYNDQSKSLVGSINLLDIPREEQNVTVLPKENKIRITSRKSLVEFHFDCLEKFNTFKEVIEAIL